MDTINESFARARVGFHNEVRDLLADLPREDYFRVNNAIVRALAKRTLGPDGTWTPTEEDWQIG